MSMNCDDCQSRICELLDADRSALLDPRVEQHVAECESCRDFLDTWPALDAQLARHAAEDVLPADFKTTLLAKLPAPRRRLTPAEIEERRERFEREYHEAIAALRRRYLFPHSATVLRMMALAGAYAFAGILLAEAMRVLPALIEVVVSQAATAQTVQRVGWIVGGVAMIYGLRRTWFSANPRLWLRRFGRSLAFLP